MGRTEKVRKIRELKKFSKQIQIEAEQTKAQEKKELLNKVNKYRKGLLDSLDFLSTPDGKEKSGPVRRNEKFNKINNKNFTLKRKRKEERFGFGGQKKRSKYNNNNDAPSQGFRGGKGKSGKTLRPRTARRKKAKGRK